MRIFENCYTLISEIQRDVYEMGHIVWPKSMQNKDVSGNESFQTKEIINYSYCLESMDKSAYLFIHDVRSINWVEEEFLERINTNHINPGKAWELRKDLWEQFLNDGNAFDYTYNERLQKNYTIDKVVDEIIKNQDSRQLVMAIWHPTDILWIGGKKRIPCSIYYQILVRNGKVNIIYNQRSADIITHFGNDVYLAWKMMEYIAKRTGLENGFLYHNIASLHCYQKDWDKLKTCIEKLKSNG
jgi:thymidylate synthase